MKKRRRPRKGNKSLPGRPLKKGATRREDVPNTCFREEPIRLRMVGPQPASAGWEPYSYGAFPRNPASNGLVRFRLSEKWFPGASKRDASIPFIDHTGHIHALSLGTWRCSPPQLFATISSTVHKRLMAVTRHQNKKKRCNLDWLFKISLVYTITNNDSFFRRCLSMLKSMDPNIRKFVYYHIKNLDANRRFLYDQALNCALWFQSRVRKCRPRVMSTRDIRQDPRPATHSRTEVLSTSNFNWDEWMSPFGASNRLGLRRMIDSTVGRLFKSSSSFRG